MSELAAPWRIDEGRIAALRFVWDCPVCASHHVYLPGDPVQDFEACCREASRKHIAGWRGADGVHFLDKEEGWIETVLDGQSWVMPPDDAQPYRQASSRIERGAVSG